MKKIISLTVLLIIGLTILPCNQASAQGMLKNITNKTKKSVEKKVEERIMNKVDKEIDKSLDKIEQAIDKNEGTATNSDANSGSISSGSGLGLRSQERLSGLMSGMGISGTPIPIADNYSFDQLIQTKMESYNADGELTSEGDLLTLFCEDSKNMAYQTISGGTSSEQGIFILDTENKATIMLSDENGQKSGIVYGMGSMTDMSSESLDTASLEDTPEYYAANPNVQKTGKTKNIAGYTCEQFLHSDENTDGEFWVARDLKVRTNDFMSLVFNFSTVTAGIGWGYVMESTLIQKQNGEKLVMTVTKVDNNTRTRFNLSEYEIVNMGNISLPSE